MCSQSSVLSAIFGIKPDSHLRSLLRDARNVPAEMPHSAAVAAAALLFRLSFAVKERGLTAQLQYTHTPQKSVSLPSVCVES